MTIEQIKAARDAVAACIEMSDNTSVPENERVVWSQGTTAKPFIHIGMLKMILPLLDQAINAPDHIADVGNMVDLEVLKRELCDKFSETSIEDSVIHACIDHLAPRIVREGWQPIETAPKDGTKMLAYNGNHVSCVEYEQVKNGFCYVGTFHRMYSIECWMPLPQPPASKRD
jgi:hypothetical protein